MSVRSQPATRRDEGDRARSEGRPLAQYGSFGGWGRLFGRLALVALVVLALVVLLFELSVMAQSRRAAWDFSNLYTGGWIVRHGLAKSLYNVPLQRAVQLRLLPQRRFLPFDHPPFEGWLCLLFAYLSYRQAYLAWAGFSLLVLVPSLYFLRSTKYYLETIGFLAWLACSLPLIAGTLVLGQDSLLLVPVFLVSFLALKRRWDYAAGLALGAGLFRFEIMLPLVFIFFLRCRWKLLAGFATAAALALFASVALVGWGGLAGYGQLLLDVGRAGGSQADSISTATMPSLRGAVATLLGTAVPQSFLFPLVLAGTLVLLGWAAWQFKDVANPEGPGFDLEFSLATVAALLASYHLFVHELTPLIVVGFLMLGYEGAAKKAGVLRDRAGTALLLLFAVVFLVGGAGFGFHDFSVLFIVLLGLMVWLTQEISDEKNLPAQ